MANNLIEPKHIETVRELIKSKEIQNKRHSGYAIQPLFPELCDVLKSIIDENGPTFSTDIGKYFQAIWYNREPSSITSQMNPAVKLVGDQYGLRIISFSDALRRVHGDFDKLKFERCKHSAQSKIYYANTTTLDEFVRDRSGKRFITEIYWTEK